jgi:hypothetical protein
MKFRAGSLEFNASIAEASQSPSPRTGEMLRSLTIQFRAQKAAVHEQALDEAEQRQVGGLFSLGESGEPDVEWRVRASTSTYVGNQPWGMNHHVWRIEQVERLACQRLVLKDIELEPYDYVEEVAEDGTVRLAARALISASDLESLSKISGPIDVIRIGISPAARRMSLQYVWSERTDALAVVVRCEDVREPRLTLGGLGLLAEADLEDLIAVLAPDTEALGQRRHARRHVSDIDAWRL